jgi:hypothetical protein
MRWEVVFPELNSTPNHKSNVDIGLLNAQIQRRFQFDHGPSGLGEPGARPLRRAQLNRNQDDEDLAKALGGIDPNWATTAGKWSMLSYDPAHFMRNFAQMLTVDKHSDIEKVFNSWVSEVLFKIMGGEHNRGRAHARQLGMTDERIKRLPRKYWRRILRYACPDPNVIIRGLFDIYCFFRDLPNPEVPESTTCLKSDAHATLFKELWYVQQGLLSDMPGIDMYVPIGKVAATKFTLYRCLRTASPLEGMHFHFRLAQHPSAKRASLKLLHARGVVFDFVWNAKAAVKARLMPDVGHFSLWFVDALADIYNGLDIPRERLPLIIRR